MQNDKRGKQVEYTYRELIRALMSFELEDMKGKFDGTPESYRKLYDVKIKDKMRAIEKIFNFAPMDADTLFYCYEQEANLFERVRL